jgi:hypothetical protein
VDCLDAELVVAFLEGRLEPEVISAIEPHVAGCPDCMDLLGEATRSTLNPASPSETQERPGKARPPLARGAGLAGISSWTWSATVWNGRCLCGLRSRTGSRFIGGQVLDDQCRIKIDGREGSEYKRGFVALRAEVS